MDFWDKVILLCIILSVGLPFSFRGSNLNLSCKIRGHNTFVNTPFDYAGNVGESTLRCWRCHKDIKNLGYQE